MGFDLRTRYSFDSTEGQIPEGQSSVWGEQNSHANCVPSSFTAALGLLGYPDIDPEQIIVDEYGLTWRGGTDFSKSIDWIQRNVANPPTMTDGGFDFDLAEAAGQAGAIPIIAGWIDAPSVTFNAVGEVTGWSHASILAAHIDPDDFVIFNIWQGVFQTYSRQVITDSLYEMSVMTKGDEMLDTNDPTVAMIIQGIRNCYNEIEGTKVGVQNTYNAIQAIPGVTAGSTDLTPVLNAIADLKTHPAVASDPALLALVQRIDGHFSGK